MSAENDISLDEKRVYAGGSARPVFVATETGLARVSVSGDLAGEFGLAVRAPARDVSTANGRVVAATDEVQLLTDDGPKPLGFPDPVAVGFADGIIAANDERVARYGDGAWETLLDITGVTAIADGVLATDAGVVGFDGESQGLDAVRDILVGPDGPIAATATGLYRGPEWEQLYADGVRSVALREERLLAVTDSGTLLEQSGEEWQDLDAPGDVADVTITADAIYAISTDGTFLANAGEGWRSRVLGLPGAKRLAAPRAHE